jgi:beta-xylosidase
MDKAGVTAKVKVKSKKAKPCLIVLVVFSLSCASPPATQKPMVPTPSPTPIREGSTVDKPVNVSFSTYSTAWPVGWEWIDPEEQYSPVQHDVKREVLRVRLKSKKELANDRRTAPRYVKAITGDFQIETKLIFNPTQDFQGAGLLVYVNDANYLIFERSYGGVGGGAGGLRLDRQTPDSYSALVTPKDIQFDAPEIELRIMRSGNIFAAFWRADENGEWREAGTVETDYPETVMAGLIARNTAGEMVVDFRYIRLLPVEK